MPTDVTPESEARWQAWQAKGQASESRWRHRIGMSLFILVCSAAIVASFVLGL
jgi:hypothetical protein